MPGRTLARISYYRGVVEQLQGDKKGKAIDYWRAALVLDDQTPWEPEVLKADDPETLFEALRSEVRSRDKVDLGVPEAVGAAKLYVDGGKVASGDRALTGQHLAQITCPDGKTYGVWTDFAKPLKWFALCPGGVDTTVVVANQAQDDFGEFGPSFGAPSDDSGDMLDVPFGGPEPQATAPSTPAPTQATPAEKPAEKPAEAVATKPVEAAPAEKPKDEKPAEKPKDEKPAEAVAEKPKDEKPVEKPKKEKPEAVAGNTAPSAHSGPGAGVFLLAGGGALLAGGAVTNFVLVNPLWADIQTARDDASSISRDDADALTARFNTMRIVTLGLLGGGVALTGVGVLLDSPVLPTIGPGQIGVTGRF